MQAVKEGLLCAEILLGILFVMGGLASVTAPLYLVQCKIDASGSGQLILPCDVLVTEPISLCEGGFQLLIFHLSGQF